VISMGHMNRLNRGGVRRPAKSSVRRLALGAAMLATVVGRPVAAQTRIVGDSIHASKTLFTWRDAALAGGFTVLTIAMFPIDQRVARRLQDTSTQANRFFKSASTDVQYIASPGSVIIGVGMYGVGKLGHWRDVADLGLHGTEAVALSSVITTAVKDLAGRARPYVSVDTNAHDFQLGRGFGNGGFQSFPSGHSTAAFAAASVVTSESQRWWPHETWIVGPVMYGGATLVALSRMYNNKHWASDVVLGAGIGTFSGIKVVRYNHGHPHNFIDRALLGLEITPTPGGAVLGVNLTR
jgi:membrane-associated phospholipid phosphatase